MIKLTAKKIVGSVIAVLVVFAALFTVVDTPLNWWRLINGNEIDFGRLFSKQSETTPQGPTVAAKLTPTATPARTAKAMLKTALSVPLPSERGKALRIVANTGVAEWDYETSITAGQSTPVLTKRVETLTFVARCAAQDGLFETADEAATYIPNITDRASIKIEILEMRHRQVTLGIGPIPGRPGWINCR